MASIRRRSGFSLMELLTVMVIVGIVFVLSLPRLSSLADRNGVRAAKRQLQSYVVVARAAAIRRGYPAHFGLSSSTISVTLDTASTGTAVAVRQPLALATTQKVTVTVSGGATTDNIDFNTRGFATNLSGTRTYVITRGAYTDSLCISKLGMINRCGL